MAIDKNKRLIERSRSTIRIWAAAVIIFAPVTLVSSEAQSEPVVQTDIENLISLEEKVWTAPDSDIPALMLTTTKGIQSSPNSSFYHYLHGQLLIRSFMLNPYDMQILRQAAELGQQAIDLRPDKDFGYVIAAQVLDMMGYSENALRLADPVINRKISSSWRTSFLKSKILAASIGVPDSLALLQKSLEAKFSQPKIILPHAIALIESKYFGLQKIDKFSEWVSRFPDSPTLKLSLATALTDNKKYREAHEIYTAMSSEYPNFIEAKINDSILLYRFLNEPNKAVNSLRAIIKSDSFSKFSRARQTLVRNHLASSKLTAGRVVEATKEFESAITSAKDPQQWIDFAHQAFRRSNKISEFTELLTDLTKKLPGTGSMHALHGTLLSEDLADHTSAIEAFDNAIILEPGRSEFYNGLGLTYYRLNNMDAALLLFSQASAVNPSDATARYNEACVLSLLGRTNEALGSLKEAINLDPQLIRLAREDGDLENLRDTEDFNQMIVKNNTLRVTSKSPAKTDSVSFP
ncbi:MAG: tetratricopeptide repeat protein [Pseudobacteriovorax sp.]|nr:tetratricopeptide repeat protein [Pseudobacteriovorax sp.]